ncbi:SDR family oxidoreductase [Myxococcus sp. K15C18031901]|uniref:SDR family NAD(P)-dependent oxidoreductase n=1 Tax=Myxococcus dinghuensis TaxID=2906761 RepID=UPI0020A6F0AB|nr:SDR family oxidoreductase [Myxococcus dinghuensis]MCP3099057.1 SDR family oxidoreductase [Myxococcus dinghuensis]
MTREEAARRHDETDTSEPDSAPPPEPSAEDVARCLEVLRAVARLPDDHPLRHQVEAAATQVQRGFKKRLRRARRVVTRQEDRATLQELADARVEENGVRVLPAPEAIPEDAPAVHTRRSRRCYMCGDAFKQLHPVYLSLCPDCAELSLGRRRARLSLEGRRALVTGGRIKVGFHVALRLLRDGAHVHVTSRFPRDAAARFAQEPDFEQWRERLVLHALDLRYPQQVLAFVHHLDATQPHLDILVNNAAQTVRLTPERSVALLAGERELAQALPTPVADRVREVPGLPSPEAPGLALLPVGTTAPEATFNGWVARLDEVAPLELVEAQLINAVAPFLLCSRLKPLLTRSPFADRYILNVSAVEGQFTRGNKTAFHPHTNMAKAALNMLTRTSAEDYAQDGIFMNSVDPGWISNENPEAKRRQMEAEGFLLPLDGADAAARVCEPLYLGFQGHPVHGRFLKDFREAPW